MSDSLAQVELAGFWRRMVGAVADLLFFTATIYSILFFLFGAKYFSWLSEHHGLFDIYDWPEPVITQLVPLIIAVAMWTLFGATPGKFLVGCRVVDAQTLQPPRARQALLRYVSYFVSLLPLGLGFLWIAFDKRKQGFHDKIAGTLVILEDEQRKSLDELEREAS